MFFVAALVICLVIQKQGWHEKTPLNNKNKFLVFIVKIKLSIACKQFFNVQI